ncbi:MAG: 2Fe-2S iron-sulfur cluster-binding protein, partial [Desulfotignum sp.]|nr:2Fe-2S iron-sulfur cluster-binding protein [Desulfotignum sp.]
MTHTIQFLPHNKQITVADGESLIRVAMEAGVHINASCGGSGMCGKCRVLIESGEVADGISEKLTDQDREKGYRLACLAKVTSDVTVRIPVESEVETSRLEQTMDRHTAQAMTVDMEDLKEGGLFIPPVEKIYLEMDPPTEGENRADVARIMHHLRIHHDEHRLTLDLSLIRRIPDIIRQDNFKVTATILRPVREDGKNEIINIEPGDTTDRNFAIAVDIGTTTVFGQVLDLHTGEVLAQQGEFNAQISYGEDVISRIMYSEKGDGLATLHQRVVETINKILKVIIKKAKIETREVSTIT